MYAAEKQEWPITDYSSFPTGATIYYLIFGDEKTYVVPTEDDEYDYDENILLKDFLPSNEIELSNRKLWDLPLNESTTIEALYRECTNVDHDIDSSIPENYVLSTCTFTEDLTVTAAKLENVNQADLQANQNAVTIEQEWNNWTKRICIRYSRTMKT